MGYTDLTYDFLFKFRVSNKHLDIVKPFKTLLRIKPDQTYKSYNHKL